MSKIVLSSVILFAGNKALCPICGKKKNLKKRDMCNSCNEAFGDFGELAVFSVQSTMTEAMSANDFADGGSVKRTTINSIPVFAQVRIPKDAKLTRPGRKGIKDFYQFSERMVMEEGDGKIGKVPFFAFGLDESDLGEVISAVVNFKKKEVLDTRCQSNYVRVQKIVTPIDLASDVRLHITGSKDMRDIFVPELPKLDIMNFIYSIKGQRRKKEEIFTKYYIGFSRI